MLSPALLSATADQIGPIHASHVLMGPLGRVGIAFPTLGQLTPAINLLIDAALIALLLYILLAARKGR
ncbi:hypothetical protein [Collinsella phocaeensis]|uniref:hypothetical protein n=1 Tax=Collinsella phocaeensis TaxID=1871016 RepID=UPI0009311FFA|nr:hypothetical protein [Collinsella phocaeensis]